MAQVSKPLVYLAGPYTSPDPCVNTNEAIQIANEIMERYPVVVFVPHLSHFWHTVTPRPYDWWLEYDMEFVRRSDIVFRMSGESPGADLETEEAKSLGIPVVYTYAGLGMFLP